MQSGAVGILRKPFRMNELWYAVKQAMARYKAGLSTAIELADAERLLTQAEMDDAIARLNVWRALLGVAVAQGDLEPLLKLSER